MHVHAYALLRFTRRGEYVARVWACCEPGCTHTFTTTESPARNHGPRR